MDLKSDTWEVIKSYFEETNIIKHQLDSYNFFIHNLIPKATQQFNPIQINFNSEQNQNLKYNLKIYFTNYKLGDPIIHENNGTTQFMKPIIARKRNLTYGSPMYLDVSIQTTTSENDKVISKQTNVIPKILFGNIPIMVKSDICILKREDENNLHQKNNDECRSDPGGYFIINGSEKVIVSQERGCANKMYCFKKKHTKYKEIVEVKSINENCTIIRDVKVYLTNQTTTKKLTIKVSFPNTKEPIPLFVIFRLLEFETDKEIIDMLLLNIEPTLQKNIIPILKDCIQEVDIVKTKKQAINYLISKSYKSVLTCEKI